MFVFLPKPAIHSVKRMSRRQRVLILRTELLHPKLSHLTATFLSFDTVEQLPRLYCRLCKLIRCVLPPRDRFFVVSDVSETTAAASKPLLPDWRTCI